MRACAYLIYAKAVKFYSSPFHTLLTSISAHGTAPTAPFLEELIPVYSYDREELQSVEILLAVSYHECVVMIIRILSIQADSTVDPNDLPITFQVNVERSSQDDIPISCFFNFSAKSKCSTTYAQKYRCGINFSVRRCSQLLFQQEQEAANYQIRFFAETSIGRSLSANSSVLGKLNFALYSHAVYRSRL